MGVSRSASTVIAYAMKEYEWSFEEALKHVKERRSIVQPNGGFLRQLQTYQGILGASKQRHSYLWDPSSAPPPQLSSPPEPPSATVSLNLRQRKMNLRALMRSISEMEVMDTAPEERNMREGNGHLEKLDTVSESQESASEQLDSVSSMDETLLERKESFMDQEEDFHEVQESGPTKTDSNQKSSALLEENPSLDEVFGSSSPSSPVSHSTSSSSSSARRRSRRKKKLGSQQSVESSQAGHAVKSQSVSEVQGAALVSKRLQEAGHHSRKARIIRQSNVGEAPEEC